jgi:hypothetical protein
MSEDEIQTPCLILNARLNTVGTSLRLINAERGRNDEQDEKKHSQRFGHRGRLQVYPKFHGHRIVAGGDAQFD